MKKVIQIQNLSKMYDLGLVGTGTLSKDLNRTWARLRGKPDPYATLAELNVRSEKSKSNTVWALKDINLEVEQGEVLGIIGKNGAGKSTLLKILSRITTPTTGFVKMQGRVGSLLEVGTGMHPEMTARQNIFLNGAIMGMTRYEIKKKLDDIIEFAGIGKYIDTPIKRFSSGMKVRLGFAVAAFLEPEILIVDEVLAVGDAEFQKKAIGKMQDVSKGGGRTVLFVSHNMASVKQLCSKGIILTNGSSTEQLDIDSTINQYLNDLNTNTQLHEYVAEFELERVRREGVFIEKAVIFNNDKTNVFKTGGNMSIRIDYICEEDNATGDLHMAIYNNQDYKLTRMAYSYSSGDQIKFKKHGVIICYIPKLPILPGSYYINLSLHLRGFPHHQVQRKIFFDIDKGDFFNTGKFPNENQGDFLLDTNWQLQ